MAKQIKNEIKQRIEFENKLLNTLNVIEKIMIWTKNSSYEKFEIYLIIGFKKVILYIIKINVKNAPILKKSLKDLKGPPIRDIPE